MSMLVTRKPRNARSKRALEKRDAKESENAKSALFVHGLRTGDKVNEAMRELAALKKPDVIMFNKKNDITPFDDPSSLEFFSAKNDASLFVVGSNQKKRRDNLVWVRMFDNQVLDMLEMGVLNSYPMSHFKGSLKPQLGNRPLFHFSGPQFALDESLDPAKASPMELASAYANSEYPAHQHLKSLLMDFYRGEELPRGQGIKLGEHQIALSGLQHIISVTAGEMSPSASGQAAKDTALGGDDTLSALYAAGAARADTGTNQATNVTDRSAEGSVVYMRTYALDLRASGERKPRVELIECGPSFDFVLRRRRPAALDQLAQSLKRPKAQSEKSTLGKGDRKNVDVDDMGDIVGQVHLGRQDLGKLQTRKMKGLKANIPVPESEDEYFEEDDPEGDEDFVTEDVTARRAHSDESADDDDEDDDDDDQEDEDQGSPAKKQRHS